jgi:hypothetical protein
MNIWTNFLIRLQRHFAKYEQRQRFKNGFSMLRVVANKSHGTERSITAEKCLCVCCSLDCKKLPNNRLFHHIKWRLLD